MSEADSGIGPYEGFTGSCHVNKFVLPTHVFMHDSEPIYKAAALGRLYTPVHWKQDVYISFNTITTLINNISSLKN